MDASSDLKAFNQLFTDYQRRFIRFANSYVRDIAIAEDITIESLMYYWENRHILPDDVNIPAYVLTTIKHKCLNHLEHLRVREEYSEKMQAHAVWQLNVRISTLKACDPNELFTKEIQELVDKTLASLPEQTCKVFQLSRYENKSHKEIATQLGITTKGVEYHISKALAALRAVLKEHIFIYLFL